jgi:ribosome maturation factor RimP
LTYVYPLFCSMELRGLLDSIMPDIRHVLDIVHADLFDALLQKKGNRIILSLIVDTDEGITLDECALINRNLCEILEEKDIIPQRYVVEVASPGLDRLLRDQRDFKRALGDMVEVWLSDKVQDKDFISGFVKQADLNSVLIEQEDGNQIELPYKKINKAKRKI